jgi:hypothetical protein
VVNTIGTYDLKSVSRELERRDQDWIKKGTDAEAIYTKPRHKLTDRERASVDTLLKHGIKLETLPESNANPANIDFMIDGHLVEEKSPNNTGIANIDRNVSDAVSKWIRNGSNEPITLVYSNIYGVRTDSEVLADLLKVARGRGVNEVIYINQDRNIVRLWP